MHYSDPRYQFIKDATHDFVNRHFETIPSILFEKLVANGMEYDEVLELVDTKYRECPECNENCAEIGDELDDGDHKWSCPQCKAVYDEDECSDPWERLALGGPDHGWPGAHGTVFWTTWNTVADHAAQCGFEVYESPLFNGYVLAIDGGGYDFYDAHWMPLYMDMEIEWHKNTEGWDEAVKEAKRKEESLAHLNRDRTND